MDYSVAGLCVQKESENTNIIHVIIAPEKRAGTARLPIRH